MSPICDICMSDLAPDGYSELVMKTHSGALAPVVTRPIGYLCAACTERLQGGMAGAAQVAISPQRQEEKT
ncbi:MAG: hypothetical protein M0Z43_06005 [Acidithiobacillus sp.]|nr:hypothetical protein [Acidithiobacillus sp.]